MKVILALLLCLAVVQALHVPAIRQYKPNKWSLNHDVKTANSNDRILGGEDADIANHPYQLSLQWRGFHICAAIVISQRFALSAAHCFLDDDLPSDFLMRAGSSQRSSGGYLIGMDEILIHPDFDDWTLAYDSSIIHSVTPFTGPNIASIQVIAVNQPSAAGTRATVTGWGLTANGGSLSEQLQAVDKPTWLNDDCDAVWGPGLISNINLCAGGELGRDSCNGDSGGPLVNNDGYLIGIVSWGSVNCGDAYPSVYVNITTPATRSFITQYVTDLEGGVW